MTTKILYRYIRDDGGITTSTIEPIDKDYDILVRLIANERKLLTNDGYYLTPCVDIEEYDINNWYEVNDPDY